MGGTCPSAFMDDIRYRKRKSTYHLLLGCCRDIETVVGTDHHGAGERQHKPAPWGGRLVAIFKGSHCVGNDPWMKEGLF
jgi:hypothetical protein